MLCKSEDKYPLCGEVAENNEHILHCGFQASAELREDLRQELQDEMIRVGTHPDLVTIAIRGSMIRNGEALMMDLKGHLSENDLRQLLVKQNTIGWFNFMLGFWTYGSREVQQQFYSNTGDQRNIDSWTCKVQLALWEFVCGEWNFRNKQVHGETV